MPIVNYKLNDQDVARIRDRRTNSNQMFDGNDVQEGNVFPMLVIRVWPDSVNGQVFLDGNDSHWVMSVRQGSNNGEWSLPVI